MRRLALGVLVVALGGCAALTPGSPPSGPRGAAVSRQRLAEARAVLTGGAPPGAALAALDAAVAADPGSVEARALRAELLERALDGGAVGEEHRGAARQTLRNDLVTVIRAARDPLEVALARDGLRRLDRRAAIPVAPPACPAVTAEDSRRAYHLVLAGQAAVALDHYRRVVERCPQDAHAWAFLGRTEAMVGDPEEARKALGEALRRDPWNRAAHGFLADLELRRGQWRAARESAVLGVLSDPTSEVGWERLRQVTLALGGQWHRVPSERPLVRRGRDGKPAIFWPFRPEERRPGEALFWEGLALAEAAEILREARAGHGGVGPGGSPPAPRIATDALAATGSALSADERRTRMALEFCRRMIIRDTTRDSEVYRIMERSDAAGFLDEAIFLFLMDRRLVPAYLDYRDRHRPRLVEYVTTLVAPVPGGARP